MNFEVKQNIKNRFNNLTTVQHLADLLNFIEKADNNSQNLRKLTARDLNNLAINKDKHYSEYSIPKKNGKERWISAPDNYLKRIQNLINTLLQVIFEGKYSLNNNGFIEGRGIINNALPHVNKRYLVNIDIQNYFPSINFRRVKVVLELRPFNLSEKRERIGFIIANIVTYKNHLPQGAPSSPIISNLVTQKLDRRLTKLCLEKKIKYSRYADDITFSSNKNILTNSFIDEIEKIIKSENFEVNNNKTRFRSHMDRQEVTGLIVNQKLNLKKEYTNTIRAILNNWEKGGTSYAQQIYLSHSNKPEFNIDFRDALRGYIDFLGLVKGKDSNIYKKLKLKFEYLHNKLDYKSIEHLGVRNQLVKDNRKMELILLDQIHSSDDKFISFCTSAFHQIENLLNYYYYLKYPDINDLKRFLLDNNPVFRDRWKNIERLSSFKRVRDFDINNLVYLYEKEFYFDRKIYYNQEITFLREIRNDDSHRCSILSFDKDEIIKEYEKVKEKWIKFEEKHKRKPEKQKDEIKLELKVKLIEFMEYKSYKKVRSIVRDVLKNTTNSTF